VAAEVAVWPPRGGAHCGAGAAAVTFGWFNPVQSAKPIFARHDSPTLQVFRDYARANGGRAVALGMYGSVLNGAGAPALNHTLLPPDRFAISLPVRISDAAAAASGKSAGALDSVEAKRTDRGWAVLVVGWAPFAGVKDGQALEVALAPGRPGRIVRASAYRLPRPEVAIALQDPAVFAAGFVMRVQVEAPPDAPPIRADALRIRARHPAGGVTRIPAGG
jgi:hypothetical protein